MPNNSSLLIFDTDYTGHHPAYVLSFLSYACQTGESGLIYLAVPPSLLSRISGSPQFPGDDCPLEIVQLPLSSHTFDRYQRSNSLLHRAWLQWHLLKEEISRTNPDHCLAMYIDHLLLPLAFGLTPGCKVSGIYFRPTFHYRQFSSYSPTFSDRVRELRQKLLVQRSVRSPVLGSLFCPDPFAPEAINSMVPNDKAKALPEPVYLHDQNCEDPSVERERLGVGQDRIAFLLFGHISERKGVIDVLDACEKLSAAAAGRITLLIAGSVEPRLRTNISVRIDRLQDTSAVQILLHDRFIPEIDIQSYFKAADIVLTPYRRHVGMSGVFVRSAATQRPIISSGYGLVGEIVRKWGLGELLDSNEPHVIASCLEDVVQRNGRIRFDASAAKKFAEKNSVEAFGRVLCNHLLGAGL